MTALSGRPQRLVNDKLDHRRRLVDRPAARLLGARKLPLGLARVARRPIDCLAILTASVASVVILTCFVISGCQLAAWFKERRLETFVLEGLEYGSGADRV